MAEQQGETAAGNPLRFPWVFWFMQRAQGAKPSKEDYMSEVKQVATVATVEDFWAVYSRLKRPSELPNTRYLPPLPFLYILVHCPLSSVFKVVTVFSDYHFFKAGIRPTWEDNLLGGKWIIRLKKGISARLWEDLVLHPPVHTNPSSLQLLATSSLWATRFAGVSCRFAPPRTCCACGTRLRAMAAST